MSAERRELESAACRNLTDDELRIGVVSRSVALELAVACSYAKGAFEVMAICTDFNREPLPDSAAKMQAAIDLLRTVTSKGSEDDERRMA